MLDISPEFSIKGLRYFVKNTGTSIAEIQTTKCTINKSALSIHKLVEVYGVDHVSDSCAFHGTLSPSESKDILFVAFRDDVDQLGLDKVYAAISAAFETVEIEISYKGPLDNKTKVRTYASRPADDN